MLVEEITPMPAHTESSKKQKRELARQFQYLPVDTQRKIVAKLFAPEARAGVYHKLLRRLKERIGENASAAMDAITTELPSMPPCSSATLEVSESLSICLWANSRYNEIAIFLLSPGEDTTNSSCCYTVIPLEEIFASYVSLADFCVKEGV